MSTKVDVDDYLEHCEIDVAKNLEELNSLKFDIFNSAAKGSKGTKSLEQYETKMGSIGELFEFCDKLSEIKAMKNESADLDDIYSLKEQLTTLFSNLKQMHNTAKSSVDLDKKNAAVREFNEKLQEYQAKLATLEERKSRSKLLIKQHEELCKLTGEDIKTREAKEVSHPSPPASPKIVSAPAPAPKTEKKKTEKKKKKTSDGEKKNKKSKSGIKIKRKKKTQSGGSGLSLQQMVDDEQLDAAFTDLIGGLLEEPPILFNKDTVGNMAAKELTDGQFRSVRKIYKAMQSAQ